MADESRVAQAEQKMVQAMEEFVAAKRGVEIDDVSVFPSAISSLLLLIDYSTMSDDGHIMNGTLIHPMGKRIEMLGLLDEAQTRFRYDIHEDYAS